MLFFLLFFFSFFLNYYFCPVSIILRRGNVCLASIRICAAGRTEHSYCPASTVVLTATRRAVPHAAVAITGPPPTWPGARAEVARSGAQWQTTVSPFCPIAPNTWQLAFVPPALAPAAPGQISAVYHYLSHSQLHTATATACAQSLLLHSCYATCPPPPPSPALFLPLFSPSPY